MYKKKELWPCINVFSAVCSWGVVGPQCSGQFAPSLKCLMAPHHVRGHASENEKKNWYVRGKEILLLKRNQYNNSSHIRIRGAGDNFTVTHQT